MSDKIRWGRMRGLHRCHYHMGHIIRLNLGGHTEEATAYACMMCRAMHQVFIDGGSWADASLMLPEDDPIDQAEFGAEERDVETLASYHQARWQLRRQRSQYQGQNQWGEHGWQQGQGGKWGKWKDDKGGKAAGKGE